MGVSTVEAGRQALVRGEFRQAVWEATSINPFVTYNVHRTSTFLCQDAVPTYALNHRFSALDMTYRTYFVRHFIEGLYRKITQFYQKGYSIFEFSDFDYVRKKSFFNQKSLRHGHWPTLRHERVKLRIRHRRRRSLWLNKAYFLNSDPYKIHSETQAT